MGGKPSMHFAFKVPNEGARAALNQRKCAIFSFKHFLI